MRDLPNFAAYGFDGRGRASKLAFDPGRADSDPTKAPDARRDDAFLWLHLRRDAEGAETWLRQAGLDPVVVDALTAEETRPRCAVLGDGVLLNLRGVNLRPGEEPEDMISVRLWIEERRIVGVWLRPLMAVGDLFDAIERGQAPSTPGDLVAKLALRLADRAEPTVADLNEKVDAVEDEVFEGATGASRAKLTDARRAAIAIRRYMVPQRDALTTLEIEDVSWLRRQDRGRLREAADRVTRLGEELDAIRDRAQIVQDEIMVRRGEEMNRSMLVLSAVAAIFLPLSLLTGLLGVNVAGIPGADSPFAFALVSLSLVALAALQVYLFRRFGLFR